MIKIAVICASGIGDALLMQIAAEHLRVLGNEVTTFSDHLSHLQGWFPYSQFAKQPSFSQIESILGPFDAILLQHDNTPKARAVRALAKPVYSLYAAHLISKHGPLRPQFDVLFDRRLSMGENIRLACNHLFKGKEASLQNGLVAPPHLQFQKYPKRIVLHPTSTSPQKNWLKERFFQTREELKKLGFDPVFIVPPEERTEWDSPLFPSLDALASFLYESGALIGNDSGPAHLASNLGLPTLVIGPSKQHLTLWRPAWAKGRIVHPPSFVEEIKIARTNWKYFITVSQVVKSFSKLISIK